MRPVLLSAFLLAAALAADATALQARADLAEIPARRWIELVASLLALWLLRRRPAASPRQPRPALRRPSPEPASGTRW